MLKVFSNLIRSVWYLLTFRVGKAAESLHKNPGVVSANYDRIIEEKRQKIATYKEAIAAMISQEEGRRERLRVLTAEIANLQKLRDGAVAKAKKLTDPGEVAACRQAFKDFSAALNEKNAQSDRLESYIEAIAQNIANHKTNIQSLLRELDQLKTEKHDAVAEIIAAQEEAKAAESLIGISDDRGTAELQELREIRNKAAAQARISRDLAGLSTKQQEAEFRQYAEREAADSEFDQLIGIHHQNEQPSGEQNISSRIPEA